MSESCDRITYFLKKENINIHIIHLSNKGVPYKTILKENGSITCIPYNDDQEHSSNLFWLFTEQFVKKYNISHIVSFGGYLPVFLGPMFSKFLKLPYVLFFRGNDFDIAIYSPKRRDQILYSIESANLIMVNSTSKLNKIKCLFPNSKVEFIPNGLDYSNWEINQSDRKVSNTIKESFSPNKKIIGLFGQLKIKKGIQFFLGALNKFSNTTYSILIVGEIQEDVLELLNANSIEYKHFPYIRRESLIPYYLVCDTIAIPSFYEGMPNVMLEASALGIPTIGSAVDGITDFLSGFSINFLFEPMNELSCQNAVSKFLQMEQKYLTEHKLELISKVKNNFTAEIEAKRIKNLLTDI